jgi:MFS family permease
VPGRNEYAAKKVGRGLQLTDMSTKEINNLSAVERRNFIGGLWHGAFLAFGMALTQPTTVISSFVADLTGSAIWVGGLATVLTVAGVIPQPFVARWIEPRQKKMPYLMLAIYLRVISWAILAWMIVVIGDTNPELLAWALVVLLTIFYAGGGLGNIPYTDIIGKIIPADRRGSFFGSRQVLAGPLAVGAALLARRILAEVTYPDNYALLFGLAAVGLAVASVGFWIIREPTQILKEIHFPSWQEYGAHVLTASRRLKPLVIVQLLTGFSLMALPFYVVYAQQELGAPSASTGWYLLAQVLGGIAGTLVWARLVDRTGTRAMITWCAIISTLTPLLAILLGAFSWEALLVVFFLAGAAFNGRQVGFNSALLELAPDTERPTFAGVNAVLILPIAFLPLLAGVLLGWWSYQMLFVMVAFFVGLGALMTRQLPAHTRATIQSAVDLEE